MSGRRGRGRAKGKPEVHQTHIGNVYYDLDSGMARLSLEPPHSASASSSRESVSRLKGRLSSLKLQRQQIEENSKLVNDMIACILDYLKHNSPANFKWQELRSGSYYDKTKISKPDEFDCMLTCEIRAEPITNSEARNYCSLKLKAAGGLWEPQDAVTSDGNFVCPRAFMTWFRDIVTRQVRDIRRTTSRWRNHDVVVKHRGDCSPAVTLEIDKKISVDVVPAVRLMEWPTSAARWRSEWLGRKSDEIVRNAQLPVCLVAKIKSDESRKEEKQCKWWRLSFSAAEKDIILYADGEHRDSLSKTSRKSLLRLLKNDLEIYNTGRGKDQKSLCSYHMKTLFLHYLDRCPNDESWQIDGLPERYVEALRMLIKYLEDKALPHYFIGRVNTFEEVAMKTSDWNSILKHFTDILRDYQ